MAFRFETDGQKTDVTGFAMRLEAVILPDLGTGPDMPIIVSHWFAARGESLGGGPAGRSAGRPRDLRRPRAGDRPPGRDPRAGRRPGRPRGRARPRRGVDEDGDGETAEGVTGTGRQRP